ncbi:hypothetical protein [Eubacterium barkeri]|uniref:Uncharacterized protein n=1 Tax=Eubacterium barkeri TaxID=1528 RepID=A0A1H3HE44_EUBBA|nr:hypothetical protein [Eubacterium barkeri]SDY13742.1 hypothetical protein SAMN04488579_11761 [Eubacterium barkeri]
MWVKVEYGSFYNGYGAAGILRLNLHQLCVDEGAMVEYTENGGEKIVRRKKHRKADIRKLFEIIKGDCNQSNQKLADIQDYLDENSTGYGELFRSAKPKRIGNR